MRLIFPLLLGLGGAAILCALGIWQLQRLEWKEAILAEIEMRLSEDPIDLPDILTEAQNEYQSVRTTGVLTGPEIHVLTTVKPDGPGFRIIRTLQRTSGQKILVDLGYVAEADKAVARPEMDLTVTGNLLWPDEIDGFTPEPNLTRNIWFARDTPSMAAALDTDPILIVMRDTDHPTGTRALPVTVNVANDHLEYAITWFSLMLVWIGMTGFLLWRIRNADS